MKCSTPYCRNVARKSRKLCCTCGTDAWRKKHPIRYLWHNLKHHAKDRGHDFTISYEWWEKFCERTQYHILKGREPNSLTVDRINETRGYHEGNVRVLRHECNFRRNFVPYFRDNNIKTDRAAIEASWLPQADGAF